MLIKLKIYQARNGTIGAIWIDGEHQWTTLTKQQIEELEIPISKLEDFSPELYQKAYQEKPQ